MITFSAYHHIDTVNWPDEPDFNYALIIAAEGGIK